MLVTEFEGVLITKFFISQSPEKVYAVRDFVSALAEANLELPRAKRTFYLSLELKTYKSWIMQLERRGKELEKRKARRNQSNVIYRHKSKARLERSSRKLLLALLTDQAKLLVRKSVDSSNSSIVKPDEIFLDNESLKLRNELLEKQHQGFDLPDALQDIVGKAVTPDTADELGKELWDSLTEQFPESVASESIAENVMAYTGFDPADIIETVEEKKEKEQSNDGNN